MSVNLKKIAFTNFSQIYINFSCVGWFFTIMGRAIAHDTLLFLGRVLTQLSFDLRHK